MAVTKKIEIDGKEVTFKASAAVPRLYRIKFGRDIYKDLRQLEKSVGENDEDNSNLDLFSLEMFEDLAWLMARHADPANVPDSPEEFLDQFNTFSIRVAAYCRVSTGDESQQTSYTTQKAFYTNLITNKPGWRFAGIYMLRDEPGQRGCRTHPG